jgi:hypothetical protein
MAKPDLTPPRAGRLRRALPTWLHVSDIQGLAQLTTQGVLGVARRAVAAAGRFVTGA